MVSSAGDSSALVVKNTGAGDIGIGVSSPNEKLEVGGDGRVFIGDGNGNNRVGILLDGVNGSSPNEYVRIDGYDYGTSANLPLLLQPTAGGKVGIGSSIPARLLDIDGSDAGNYILEARNSSSTGLGFLVKSGDSASSHLIVAQANDNTEFIVYSDGDVKNTNGSYTAISDARIKENIEDAGDHYLEDLMQVRVRKYSLKKNNSPGPTHIGMIAQELESVFPALVSEHYKQDENGNPTDAVSYTHLRAHET